MLYKDWLYDWLENYIKPSSKKRTYTRYREIISQHIEPKLGELQLSEIKPYTIQYYITELSKSGNLKTGKGLSSNSVNAIISVISNTLKTAFSIGLLSEYSLGGIKRPRCNEKRIECFSLAEQKKIENYILNSKKATHFGIVLCLYTGIRIGELLALEWTDMDFSKGELFINKSCHYEKNEIGVFARITDSPKTNSSERIIPIPKKILAHLYKIKKGSRSIYIVSSGEKPVAIRSYQRTFSIILQKLDIPHRGFHSLRHTFATRAVECGMDVKTLSEILGHKSPTVTMNRYVHTLTEHKRAMMNKLGNIL